MTYTEAMNRISEICHERENGGYGTDSDYVDDIEVVLETLRKS